MIIYGTNYSFWNQYSSQFTGFVSTYFIQNGILMTVLSVNTEHWICYNSEANISELHKRLVFFTGSTI